MPPDDEHDRREICNLFQEVKYLNILLASGLTGLRKDVQNVTTTMGSVSGSIQKQSDTIQSLLLKQESCMTKDNCVVRAEKCKEELKPYKKQVDRHTTYFEIIAGGIIALLAWMSGFFNKIFGWG